jgi:hypothetical protein
MIRALLGVLIAALVAAFVRGLFQMILKEVGQMAKPEGGAAAPASPASAPQGSTALRKCAVCETYTPGDRMLENKYCSSACQEKSRAA